jgi:hypothetical protein
VRRFAVALFSLIAAMNSAQSSRRERVLLMVNTPSLQKVCFVDDEAYSVYLSLDIRLTNKSAQAICVPEHPSVVRLIVAKSRRDLETGKYELDIAPDPVGSELAQMPSHHEVGGQSCTEVKSQDVLLLKETSPPLLTKLKSSGPSNLLGPGAHVMTIEMGVHEIVGSKTSIKQRADISSVRSNVIRFSIPQRENPPSTCHD